MSTVTLYRGDSTEIDSFDLTKCSTFCLLGRGIYLTDKKAVATTYRTKGTSSNWRTPPVLWDADAVDRPTAIEAAFVEFHRTWWVHLNEGKQRLSKEKDERQARAYYASLVKDNLIEAEYVNGYQPPPRNWSSTPKARSLGDHRRQKRRIRVSCLLPNATGALSCFEFDSTYFNSAVLKVERPLSEDMRDLLLDRGILLKPELVSDARTPLNRVLYRGSLVDLFGYEGTAKRSTTIRTAIEPYGYIGFEYNGGTLVRGHGRHRAFCIWDDDYVNRHRVY